LFARHVDGVIWATAEVGDNRSWVEQALPDLPAPIIFLTTQNRPGMHSVSYNNYLGGRLAAQHLVDQGYRHIGHISGPSDWWEARQRRMGWEDVLRENFLPLSREYWNEGNWSSASGEQAFRQLLEAYPQMDAVFVANDQMALGVLQLACRTGLAVPEELGVVGFDGIPEAPYFWPPLTTVFQDQHRLGMTAVERIVEIITVYRETGKAVEPKPIVLQPELIVRESSTRRKQSALESQEI
jgi:DNA-binding LacI/PurR family transcriptional regulator